MMTAYIVARGAQEALNYKTFASFRELPCLIFLGTLYALGP
jgi:hypothetical protein